MCFFNSLQREKQKQESQQQTCRKRFHRNFDNDANKKLKTERTKTNSQIKRARKLSRFKRDVTNKRTNEKKKQRNKKTALKRMENSTARRKRIVVVAIE